MRDPAVKARILAETDVAPENAGSMEMFAVVMQDAAGFLFGLDEIVDYEPSLDSCFEAVAAARGSRRSRPSTTSSPRATAPASSACPAPVTCTETSKRCAR